MQRRLCARRKKALREEIEGLSNVVSTITKLRSRSEQKVSEAEMEHDSLLKLEAFAKDELKRKRRVLREIEEKENKS